MLSLCHKLVLAVGGGGFQVQKWMNLSPGCSQIHRALCALCRDHSQPLQGLSCFVPSSELVLLGFSGARNFLQAKAGKEMHLARA